MGELFTKLGIDWKLLLANTVTFFIVFWVLSKFAYRPIMNMLDKRSQTIADGLDNAKKSTAELQAIQVEKEKILRQAKTEAMQIIQQAKDQGEIAREKIVSAAQDEATATITKAKAQLERERHDMVHRAKQELADVVVAATEKVIDAQLDDKLQTKLVDQAIKQVKEAKS